MSRTKTLPVTKPKLYLLSPTMKWRTFKMLQEKLVQKDGGPEPQNFDKALWKMLRARQVYCGFRDDMLGDMWIGLELPTDVELKTLRDPPRVPIAASHE